MIKAPNHCLSHRPSHNTHTHTHIQQDGLTCEPSFCDKVVMMRFSSALSSPSARRSRLLSSMICRAPPPSVGITRHGPWKQDAHARIQVFQSHSAREYPSEGFGNALAASVAQAAQLRQLPMAGVRMQGSVDILMCIQTCIHAHSHAYSNMQGSVYILMCIQTCKEVLTFLCVFKHLHRRQDLLGLYVDRCTCRRKPVHDAVDLVLVHGRHRQHEAAVADRVEFVLRVYACMCVCACARVCKLCACMCARFLFVVRLCMHVYAHIHCVRHIKGCISLCAVLAV